MKNAVHIGGRGHASFRAYLALIAFSVTVLGEGHLYVGPTLAMYRETQELTMTPESTVAFNTIPRMADLSTFSMDIRRYPLLLNNWSRALPRPAVSRALRVEGNAIVWQPDRAQQASVETVSDSVAVKVRMAPAGKRPVMVSYVMPGWDWSARYTAVLRGQSDVSADLTGLVSLYNPTSMTFEDVRLTLESGGLNPPEPKAPGFLMLPDFSPMADMFEDPLPSRQVLRRYTLPRRVTVFGFEHNQIPFLEAKRLRGERLFLVRSEEFPLAGRGQLKPVPSLLRIPNDVRHEMGWTLPAGPVEIYEGSTLTPPVFVGQMAHAEPGAVITLQLGLSDQVMARRTRSASWLEAGGRKDRYQIELENRSDRNVQIEILEAPETGETWNLISSTVPAIDANNRLSFSLLLAPSTRQTVEYVIRNEAKQ